MHTEHDVCQTIPESITMELIEEYSNDTLLDSSSRAVSGPRPYYNSLGGHTLPRRTPTWSETDGYRRILAQDVSEKLSRAVSFSKRKVSSRISSTGSATGHGSADDGSSLSLAFNIFEDPESQATEETQADDDQLSADTTDSNSADANAESVDVDHPNNNTATVVMPPTANVEEEETTIDVDQQENKENQQNSGVINVD